MKKAVILLLLCFALASVATTSKANSALMARLRQNARQLTNLNTGPSFPCYDISYGWSGNTLVTYFVYATSYSSYTLVPGTVTFYLNGHVSYSANGIGTTYNFGPPYNSGITAFFNGEASAQFGTEISDASISVSSPSTYDGLLVYCQEGTPTE
jgi:hypothetical protein